VQDAVDDGEGGVDVSGWLDLERDEGDSRVHGHGLAAADELAVPQAEERRLIAGVRVRRASAADEPATHDLTAHVVVVLPGPPLLLPHWLHRALHFEDDGGVGGQVRDSGRGCSCSAGTTV